jgi:hypothetical protein
MHSSDVVSLRDYTRDLMKEVDKRYEQRFDAQEAATKAALNAAQLAVDKAEANATLWRANANEWRDTMDNKDRLLMTRNEAESRLKGIEKRVDDLETLRDVASGKASQNSVIGAYIVSIIGLIAMIIGTFLK